MKTLVAATYAGGRLYAAVDERKPAGHVGALAHSASIAALVPFASDELAKAAMLKLGIEPNAIAER
ncbi:hypothetical protein [Sphingomonas oryzagri]|uniref:Uncharacterized protein n=1 Tax=Sphingomonas oryzagri TaxID=3042314 RepID=A0ABT6N5S5_9SPHN|nr:hypothetical protein [Sphingomonas oryzagri]MDH7640464.1 hypothetical protein [Sphingomonas oryzagri]